MQFTSLQIHDGALNITRLYARSIEWTIFFRKISCETRNFILPLFPSAPIFSEAGKDVFYPRIAMPFKATVLKQPRLRSQGKSSSWSCPLNFSGGRWTIESSQVNLPATLASLHASYMSDLTSKLSSAMVSATVTNLSTARFTPWPTRANIPGFRSHRNGRSLCDTSFEICKQRKRDPSELREEEIWILHEIHYLLHTLRQGTARYAIRGFSGWLNVFLGYHFCGLEVPLVWIVSSF